MSAIATAYAALAAANVTVGSITPTAYAPDALPNSGETAILPLRVLDPFQIGDRAQFGFSLQDRGATVLWTIVDLLLWEQVGQGRGAQDVALDLIKYCGAYAEMIRAHDTIATQCYITRVSPRIMVLDWPRGSDVWFYAVEVTLTIEELLG